MSFQSRDLAVHVLDERGQWLICPFTGGPQEPPPPCPNSKPQCPQGTKRPGGGRAVEGGLEDLKRQLRQALS